MLVPLSGRPLVSVEFRSPTGNDLRRAGSPLGVGGTTDAAWSHRVIELCCGLDAGSSDCLPGRDVMRLRRSLDQHFQHITGRDVFDTFYRASDYWRDRQVFDMTVEDLLFDLEHINRIRRADDRKRKRQK